MSSLNLSFRPSASGLSWRDYFAEYRIAVDSALALRGGSENVELEDGVSESFTVTHQAAEIAATDLGSSAKGVWVAAAALGWEPRAWRSSTHHEPVLYTSSSKEYDTKQYQAGDQRFPAFDVRHFTLFAKDPQTNLGFQARWLAKLNPKTTKWATSFVNVTVYDPVGIPVECRADYTPTADTMKKQGKAYSVAVGERRDAEYNDGVYRIEHIHQFRTAREFTLWVDDWLARIAPGHKPLTSAP